MKSSYSICYGTSLETELPPLKTMPTEKCQPSLVGKILLEGLDAVAAIDMTPDPAGIKGDRAISAGIKKGRQSRHDAESAVDNYAPSAEVRLKFARLSADLLNAFEQSLEREG